MAKAPIPKRYAQALFSLAVAEGKQEAWLESLVGIERQLAESSAALFFSEPRIPAERKAMIVAEVAAGADAMVGNFLGLLVQKQVIGVLPSIVREYSLLLNESLGRVQASVTSAVAISAAQHTRLRDSLGAMLDKQVVLDVQEDQDIIGGLVVRVGDQIIDGSVRARLDGLRLGLGRGSLV